MTHRISMEIGENEFLTEQPGGGVFSTVTSGMVSIDRIYKPYAEEIQYHQTHGFSSNCVRCIDAAHTEAKKFEKEQRVKALFLELETCNEFRRILEIEQDLREYGVEIVDQREMARMDDYADARRQVRFGVSL